MQKVHPTCAIFTHNKTNYIELLKIIPLLPELFKIKFYICTVKIKNIRMRNPIILPKWSELSIVGKNPLVQRTYLFIPILPFIISLLSKFGLNKVIEAIPFTWQIFFYCALFFTLGSFVYQVIASKIIQQTRNWTEFIEQGKMWDHLMEYLLDIGIDYEKWRSFQFEESRKAEYYVPRLLASLGENDRKQLEFVISNQDQFKTIRYPLISHDDPPEVKFQKEQTYEKEARANETENTKITFWNTFKLADISKRIWRFVCYISFCLGFLLLAYLLIKSVYVVIANTLI